MFGSLADPRLFIYIILSFVVSITIHEFAHAYTATILGDDLPRAQGRVTLNPIAHFDPIGALFLLFVALTGFGLGWGKPVQFNPYRLRWGKRGVMLVAAAGPISNIVLALVLAVPQRIFASGFATLPPDVQGFITVLVGMNIGLAAFNLIPLPPLDGSRILLGILPDFWSVALASLERYGFIILFAILLFAPLRGVLYGVSAPVYLLLTRLIEGTSRAFGQY